MSWSRSKKVSFSDKQLPMGDDSQMSDFTKHAEKRLLGDPKKSAFEKKYFQTMLAKIQSKAKTAPRKCKVEKFQVDNEAKNMNKFVNHVLNRTYPHSQSSSANGFVFERRKSRAVSPMEKSTQASHPLRRSVSHSAVSEDHLTVVGTRSILKFRPASRPSTPDIRSSKSREILKKIQDKLEETKSIIRRIPALRKVPMSKSLDEMANLVLELDNNLEPPSGEQDSILAQLHPHIPDVCDHNNATLEQLCSTSGLQDLGGDISIDFDAKLGTGTFSKVYAANLLGSKVALKLFNDSPDTLEIVTNAFENELRILGQLRHPHIVQLLGYSEPMAIVLEFLVGGTLQSHIQSAGYSFQPLSFFSYGQQILMALIYLHHLPHPVVHMDVKSSNLLLDKAKERLKLCDFGFARSLSHRNATISLTGVKGTPAWMAPEVLAQKAIGIKSDIYSFGLVLVEMITRRRPYEGMTLKEVCEAVLQGEHPEMDPELEQKVPGITHLVQGCWSKDPESRPDTRDLFQAFIDLETHLPPDKSHVPSPPPMPPIPHEKPAFPQPCVQESPENTREKRTTEPFVRSFSVTQDELIRRRSSLRKAESQDTQEPTRGDDLTSIMRLALVRRRESGWTDQNESSSVDDISQCLSPWPTGNE